jgi:competence protein ComEC
VTLHTGSGTSTTTELYWGSGSPIWNNDGDTVIVSNANGERVLEETYS